jgi:alkanesulfonate monooxygenase SsuD/methylene tetrahydromethanopterin reductase-like flavin-dependent oxidoreductase (luciferase family)
VRRAAERGYNLMATIGPDPAIPYGAALKEFGRNPADYSIAQLRMVYVAKSSGQAWDDTQEHIHYMMQHYAKWLGGEAKDAPGDENVWDLSEARELRNSRYAEGLVIGTPEECARKLEKFRKEYACTHFVITSHFPGMDPKKSTQSLEFFAKEIMPHFR